LLDETLGFRQLSKVETYLDVLSFISKKSKLSKGLDGVERFRQC